VVLLHGVLKEELYIYIYLLTLCVCVCYFFLFTAILGQVHNGCFHTVVLGNPISSGGTSGLQQGDRGDGQKQRPPYLKHCKEGRILLSPIGTPCTLSTTTPCSLFGGNSGWRSPDPAFPREDSFLFQFPLGEFNC
jgi:hypothetical protein